MEDSLLGCPELGKTSPQDVNSLKPTFVVVLVLFIVGHTRSPLFWNSQSLDSGISAPEEWCCTAVHSGAMSGDIFVHSR